MRQELLYKVLERIQKADPRKLFMAAAIFAMILICGLMVQWRVSSSEEQRMEAKAEKQEEKSKEEAGKDGAARQKTEEEKQIEAVEASIAPGQYPIMGASSIQVGEMVAFFKENGSAYPEEVLGEGGAPDIETFCEIYYE